ncbi:MAG: anthranilate synthase component I [Thermodesulfobacteriota bacterium]|nr:anthranilate synthase component I [Thermodesulfobacteriota bacterium]
MYFPSFKEFCKKAKEGNLIPIYKEILADMETPVSAFYKMNNSRYSFLLESVEGGEKWGRYTFLGFNPSIIFKSKGSTIYIMNNQNQQEIKNVNNPLNKLREFMEGYRPVNIDGLPRFFGGAVGYLSYDIVKFFEELPDTTTDDLDLNDSLFMITDSILIFDNLKQTLKVVSNVNLSGNHTLECLYSDAVKKIDSIISRLKGTVHIKPIDTQDKAYLNMTSNLSKEQFEDIVVKAKEHIVAGDVIQVVLSQRFQIQANLDPFNIYRSLRTINPSPYMFYLKCDDLFIVGSSPEVMVRVEDKNISLRPIAGTRPRGKTLSEDREFEKDLLKDPKERAEHIMLVDLGRNDVGRVATIGTVNVNELMVIEKYSHVMHIVSNVQGILDEGKDIFNVMEACFPAGTVSGAPKVRAMEIIEDLEPTKRGPYAGAVGYFSFSGNMDFCITIRTIVIKDNTIYIQAGAGIVADSVPENEWNETKNKAKAMIRAIEMAKNGLR